MKVKVCSSARLHLGFYNIFRDNIAYGSVGVMIKHPQVLVEAWKSKGVIVKNHSKEDVEEDIRKVISKLEADNIAVEVHKAIPRHVGLGSTTQLMLSTAYAISKLYNLNLSVKELAVILGRGVNSGVGVAVFEKGGFIVDSGRIVEGNIVDKPKNVKDLPQITFRGSLPRSWYFIIAIPKKVRGLSEREEKPILELPEPMDKDSEYELYKTVLFHLIPSVVRRDIETFGKSITKIQFTIGRYFSKYQGGVFCCEETENLIKAFLECKAYGAGQSSWGPTAYGIVKGLGMARKVLRRVSRIAYMKGIEMEAFITNTRNYGALVHTL